MELIAIEVCYAETARQFLGALRVPSGTTALQAVERSGVLQAWPQLKDQALTLGVHGKLCDPSRVLRAGDRVEIYRPLAADPKAARRQRAKVAKRKPRG